MSKKTGIQWSHDTVNPTSGCDGCELWIPGKGGPCYAGNLHERRLSKSLPLLYDSDFTKVRLIPGRVKKSVRCMDMRNVANPDKPWLNGLRRVIFIGDLCDLFSAAVPFDYIKTEIFDNAISKEGLRNNLLLLTKQPQRALQFASYLNNLGIKWPENVWIGTSITSKASLPRIKHLVQIPAAHRYLSLEPLVTDPELTISDVSELDWMIVGGESDQGQYAARPFDVNWVRGIITLGKKANIAVFVKQLGSLPVGLNNKLTDHHGGDWDEWPVDLRVRQMPFGCS